MPQGLIALALIAVAVFAVVVDIKTRGRKKRPTRGYDCVDRAWFLAAFVAFIAFAFSLFGLLF